MKYDYLLDIIVVTYQQDACLRCLINSFQAQTNPYWKMHIIHDGMNTKFLDLMLGLNGKDRRLTWSITDTRSNDYGHSLRQLGIKKLGNSKYTLITNGDNYYVPIFIEKMCTGEADLVYCDMLHNHKEYKGYLKSELKRKFIDCGSVVVKTSLTKEIGWNSLEYAADWFYISEVLEHTKNTKKVDQCLFVHN